MKRKGIITTLRILIRILCIFFIGSGTKVSIANQPDSAYIVINDIKIIGNKTTKSFIIRRELTFSRDERILKEELESQINKSRENLLKTSLFNYVTMATEPAEDNRTNIIIQVEERWYTFPAFTLDYAERNFSEWLRRGDLSRTIFGGYLVRYNFRGRNEKLKLSANLGFRNEYSLLYENIIFGRKKQHYMGGEIALYRENEVTYSTFENKPVRYRSNKSYIFEKQKLSVNYTYRPAYDTKHKIYVNFYRIKMDDTVKSLNSYFYAATPALFNQLTIDYIFTHDKRNHKTYPLKGYYFEVFVEQTIGIGNGFLHAYVKPEFDYYNQISKRFYYALGLISRLSYLNSYSYYHVKGLGYDDNLRGYEPFIVDGKHYFIYKSLFKTAVIPERVTKIGFIPFEKFNKVHYALYFNINFDLGYVINEYATPVNTLDNTLLFGTGIGLDLVTYYDKVFRLEYTINRQGIKGFYIGLKAPI